MQSSLGDDTSQMIAGMQYDFVYITAFSLILSWPRHTRAHGQSAILFSGARASKVQLDELGLVDGQSFDLEYEKGFVGKAMIVHVKVAHVDVSVASTS
jgi:hypothetical protein